MTIAHKQGGPSIELEHSLPSDVPAISPFVDKLMVLLRACGCVPADVRDVEIALREALANAIIQGNHEDPRKHAHITCHKVADPTAPENIASVHGRGIYLMKALMDEVHFEEGGVVVQMRKSVKHRS